VLQRALQRPEAEACRTQGQQACELPLPLSCSCELVTRPAILFLDEPTSGLDAASAYFVMDTIRNMALKNRTVLTVIHQPSSGACVCGRGQR